MTIKQLTLHAFREFADGNLEPLRPLLHENFVEHSPGNPSGRDDIWRFENNQIVEHWDVVQPVTDQPA
jgi:predicted SnoaL-like aldol condensation-catalyzing enzyme